MPTRTNRLRPTLESLEAREVCWAGLPGLPLGGLSPIVHLGPVAPAGPRLHVADAVFTLANRTSHSVTLTVQWQGAAAAESYVLQPGESRPIWMREVERYWLPTATIRVAGGGEVFRVKAALTADGPNGPVGAGPVYSLQSIPGGGVAIQPAANKSTPGT